MQAYVFPLTHPTWERELSAVGMRTSHGIIPIVCAAKMVLAVFSRDEQSQGWRARAVAIHMDHKYYRLLRADPWASHGQYSRANDTCMHRYTLQITQCGPLILKLRVAE
jgi:hypothetical protein